MRERKSLRRECEKHFENPDHSFTAAVYGQPVHFKENGEWQEIDNSLVLNKDGRYENKANDFKVSFAKEASNEKMIAITKDGHSSAWKLENSLPAKIFMKKNKHKRQDMEVVNLASQIQYKGVFDGVDLEYVLSSKSLKENIILSKPLVNGCLTFEIETDLKPIKENGKIFFVTEADEKVFTMDAPYMFDAAGAKSFAIDVQCHAMSEGDKVMYKLTPDAEWMKAAERQWPVTIDPIISSSVDNQKIYDSRVVSGYPKQNYNNNICLFVGQDVSLGISRSLVDFELPTLNPADMVISAVLNMTCYSSYGKSNQMHVHRVLDSWDASTVTWNTMPRYDSKIIDCNIFTDTAGKSVQFDVTELVKDWYINGNQYGVLLKDYEEAGSYVELYSANCSDANADCRPRVFIQYVNYTGIQNFWTYHCQDVRRAGQVFVNDYNGNLIFKHTIDAISGNRVPYALELVYNTNDKDTDIGYGKGMRLNYHQRMESKTIDGVQYYQWTDGTGTRHYFKLDSEKNKWLDELNNDLELTIGTTTAEKYTISNKYDNKLIFNANGYLVKIKDINDNALIITYDSSNRIKKVSDGAGRNLTLAYTGSTVITVTNPAGQSKTLTVSGGYLTTIIDFDSKVITLGYTSGLMTSVTNYDGYKIVYAYTGNPARVKSIKEYVGTVEKRFLNIEYGFNVNKFTDERGRTETYLFNDAGHAVSVKNGEGYAQVREYMEDGASVNKLSHVSKLQYTAPQYIKDPHLYNFSAWSSSGDANAIPVYNYEDAFIKYGDKSLKIDATGVSAEGYFNQELALTKGKEYTFSAYLRTANEIAYGDGGGAFLRVVYKDSTGADQYCESRRVLYSFEDWVFLAVNFTLPLDAASQNVMFYCMHKNFHGTSYFDAMQVEEGKVGNRRNLIENNDFTYDLDKFTTSGTTAYVDTLVDTRYLIPDEVPEVLVGVINADVLNVRSGPDSSYSAVTQVSTGQMVTILEAVQGTGRIWYHIGLGVNGVAYKGYVATEYVTVVTDGTRTGSVNADVLNVRSGAGTGYAAVIQLPYGAIVTILGSTTASGIEWYQIRAFYQDVYYDGYVSAEYITEITAADVSDKTVNSEEIPSSVGVLSPKVMRMIGDPTKEKRLSQTLAISGKASDTFVISGWGMGNSLPLKDNNRAFGVELIFTYTDGTTEAFIGNFAGDSNQWQYVNKVVVAKKDYSSVKAGYVYNYNANKAYFDGLSLFKDEFWPSFTYDANGNVISCVDARNEKTAFAYDINNNITNVVTPKGSSFTYNYDSKHNITEAYTAAGRAYKFAYDSYGNVISYKNEPLPGQDYCIKSEYTYTSDGNYPLENMDYFGNKVTFEYDSATGNLKSVTDVNGKKTSYTHDTMGRLTSVSKPNTVNGAETNVVLNYTYENDRLKTIRHNGMDYTFVYDEFGNVTQVKAGTQTLATNTYKMNGIQLDRTLLGNGEGVCFEYDEFDRVIKKKSVKSDGTTVDLFEYVYDNQGNVAYIIDHVNNDKQRFAYSVSGQLACVENKAGDAIKYVYDADNSLKSVEMTQAAQLVSQKMSYEYNADYNETKTTTMGGRNKSTSYDMYGRVINHNFDTDNAFIVSYGYHSGTGSSDTPLVASISNNGDSLRYYYHDDGNIRCIETAWRTINYTYDHLGQLLRVDDNDTGLTTIYAYDAGFNMISEKVYAHTEEEIPTTELVSERSFAYDTVWKDKMITCGGKALTYDGAGNLTSYDGTTFTWANGRQLNSVTKADGTTASYTYNHNGQRVTKTVNGVKTEYFYSGGLLIREKSSRLDMKFTYDSVGNVVAVLYNNVEYYYVKNFQGDIIGLIDSAGTWVVSYDYHTWGNLRSMWGTLASTLGTVNPFRYRGYYYDAETGLYYVSSRYYSPEIRRFISPDKTALLEAEPMKLTSKNLYVYCDNNPVSKTDLNGEIAIAALAGFAMKAAPYIIGAGVNVLSNWIVAEASGEDFDGKDAFVAAVLGAAGAIGKFGFAISTAFDCVYTTATDGIGAGISSIFFSVFSVPGMLNITGIGDKMDEALALLLDFGGGTFGDIVVAQDTSKNTSNTKSSNSNSGNTKTIVYDTNTRKQNFKEKQFRATYKRHNAERLAFMERRMMAF